MTDATQAGPAIIIDTREQEPYAFDPHPAVIEGLKTGDYSIQGLVGAVAVERKSLADLVGCMTSGRDRFERELSRAVTTGMRRLWVVVEGTLADLATGDYRSQLHPNAALGTIAAWANRYPPVQILFAGTRSLGQDLTRRLLLRAWQDDIEGKAMG